MFKILFFLSVLSISSLSFAKTCRNLDLGTEKVKICADLEYSSEDVPRTKITNLSPAVSVERVNGFLSDGPKAAGIKLCETFGSELLNYSVAKTAKSIEGAVVIMGEQASGEILKSMKATKVLKSVDCYWWY